MTSEEMVRLVYRGGADLTFRDAAGQRVKVLKGEEFAVAPALAAILLTDPAVVAVDAEEAASVAAAVEEAGYPGMTVKELHAMAAERGIDLPARAKKDALIAALEADDEAKVAAAVEAPIVAPEAEAAEPEGAGPGAITLGDLPDSGKVKE